MKQFSNFRLALRSAQTTTEYIRLLANFDTPRQQHKTYRRIKKKFIAYQDLYDLFPFIRYPREREAILEELLQTCLCPLMATRVCKNLLPPNDPYRATFIQKAISLAGDNMSYYQEIAQICSRSKLPESIQNQLRKKIYQLNPIAEEIAN